MPRIGRRNGAVVAAYCCILALLLAAAEGKGAQYQSPHPQQRYHVTVNSARVLYYSHSYVGAPGVVTANYVTARAELWLSSADTLPVYYPAYVGSPAEDALRLRISAALPRRGACTVPLHNIAVSGLSRSQVVFRVLAPAMCAPPAADVDAAITALFGAAADREVVSGALRLDTTGSTAELCSSGFADCGRRRCAWGVCGGGRCKEVNGDYMCDCPTSRNPNNNATTTNSGVRCSGEPRTCNNCSAAPHSACTVGGCACRWPYSGADCLRRDVCVELRPCVYGACFQLGVSFTCVCPRWMNGPLCNKVEEWALAVGVAMLIAVILLTLCSLRRCFADEATYSRLRDRR